MSTNAIVKPDTYSIINNLPKATEPHHAVACYGHACLANHKGGNFLIPVEDNPILTIMRTGVYPDEATVKRLLPRPFKRYVSRYGENYTLEDVLFDWRVEHQKEEVTPVTILKVIKPHPKGNPLLFFGETVTTSTETKISPLLFNHLGHDIQIGVLYFIHNHEIIEIVPEKYL